jgi:hypothetical protein
MSVIERFLVATASPFIIELTGQFTLSTILHKVIKKAEYPS